MTAAAPSERLHTFFVVKQPGKPDRVVVWDTQDLTVGRAPENDLCIDHDELSRRHAVLSRLNNACVVKNLSTSNGTFVNGQQIDTQTLESEDVLQMAEIDFVFYSVATNPLTLGSKVVYASQLKGFHPADAASANPEATMLGLMQSADDADDDFEVRPASEFAYDLHGLDDFGKAAPTRDLDLELEAPALEELEVPTEEASGTPDDGSLQAAPAADTLSLELEIQGLSGDLRRVLESLLGKVVKLPPLVIRVKGEDLR